MAARQSVVIGNAFSWRNLSALPIFQFDDEAKALKGTQAVRASTSSPSHVPDWGRRPLWQRVVKVLTILFVRLFEKDVKKGGSFDTGIALV